MNRKMRLLSIAIVLMLLFCVFSCEGDIDALSEDAYGSVEDAAVAFKVQWPDRDEGTANRDIDDPSGAAMMAAPVDLAEECDARGVATVRVGIQNSSGATLKSATFDCSAGQGTLTGVAPQSGCSVVVSGLNYNSVEIYQGRKTGVTLHAGMNHVGTILLGRAQNMPPAAAITAPLDNSTYITGQSVTFTGTGTDVEDGTLPASVFVWESSIDGQLASGTRSFTANDLAVGVHIITLTVTDSDGASDSDSIQITVTSELDPEPPIAEIISPLDNSRFTVYDAFVFTGTGTDAEGNPLPASAFLWESSINGLFASGTHFVDDFDLSAGMHLITLTVTDSNGMASSDTITIEILNVDKTPDKLIYRIMNMDSADQGFAPLLAVNLIRFQFALNGVYYDLAPYLGDDDLQGTGIVTYEEMIFGLNEALDALAADNPGMGVDGLSLGLGADFMVRHLISDRLLIGKEIVLTAHWEYSLQANDTWVEIRPAPETVYIDDVEVLNSNRYELVDIEPGTVIVP